MCFSSLTSMKWWRALALALPLSCTSALAQQTLFVELPEPLRLEQAIRSAI